MSASCSPPPRQAGPTGRLQGDVGGLADLVDPATMSLELDLSFCGEHLCVSERVVISPATGIFCPAASEPADGAVVPGSVFGTVAAQEVQSRFAGRLMGMLALPGERVQSGQPIAWLRVESAA